MRKLLVVAVLVLAGCGGSASDGESKNNEGDVPVDVIVTACNESREDFLAKDTAQFATDPEAARAAASTPVSAPIDGQRFDTGVIEVVGDGWECLFRPADGTAIYSITE